MTEPVQNALSQSNSLAIQVSKLADVISKSSYQNGDRAALRRWAPGQPVPLAFYRLWLRLPDMELPPQEQVEGWMTLVWGLATMGADAHSPKRPFGQALAESQFSEGRLERLLSAPEDVRLDLFMSAVRFLAAKGERFNWVEAAQFVLIKDLNKREKIHRSVAEAYYRNLH